ncbi:hypothetical protein [Rhizobium leguminosarum]|uniref:hypothetical protein n=1 Tax=Rhizobium leguminosarum TaxID=384 RepID=UPI001AEC16EC|nr:hypothetical protein [Rhizobium leguminosarum]
MGEFNFPEVSRTLPSIRTPVPPSRPPVFCPGKTEVLQQIGTLDLEIEKRSQPHTTVQTPYLEAVVKGTIFHVTVGKTKASVSVDRGLVQVTSSTEDSSRMSGRVRA